MDIWEAIADLARDIHPDRLASFAGAVARLASVADFADAIGVLGPKSNAGTVRTLEAAWAEVPQVAPLEVAAGIRAGMRAWGNAREDESLELVWTGPGTGLIPTRHTEQVMLEMIQSARSDLIWITYVFHKADAVIRAMSAATARGVDLRILIDAQASWQGAQPDAPERLHTALPDARIFVWGGPPGSPASVHAKCAVADSRLAFITSANLTSAALERNMELGILIRGGPLPSLLRSHFEALIATRVVDAWRPWPEP